MLSGLRCASKIRYHAISHGLMTRERLVNLLMMPVVRPDQFERMYAEMDVNKREDISIYVPPQRADVKSTK